MFPRISSASSPWTFAFLTALLIPKVALVVYNRCLADARDQRGFVDADGTYKYFPVEALPNVRTFVENSVHLQVDGDDEEWASLVPGDGLVYLGESEGEKKPYTISMIHQLRCIDIVRQEVVELERNPAGLASRPSPLSDHCVNYLRQMVVCRGDLDFDPVGGDPNPQVFPDSYQCSDWDVVYRAIEANQRSYDAENYRV